MPSDAEISVIGIDAQRFGVLKPKGLSPSSTYRDVCTVLLIEMLKYGRLRIVQRKSLAVFYFWDTPQHDR